MRRIFRSACDDKFDIPINGEILLSAHKSNPPARSIVNPQEPAAVNARTSTMKRVASHNQRLKANPSGQ